MQKRISSNYDVNIIYKKNDSIIYRFERGFLENKKPLYDSMPKSDFVTENIIVKLMRKVNFNDNMDELIYYGSQCREIEQTIKYSRRYGAKICVYSTHKLFGKNRCKNGHVVIGKDVYDTCLVMNEYKAVTKKNSLSEKSFAGIYESMLYLSSTFVAHTDASRNNIMRFKNKAMLVDFGLTVYKTPDPVLDPIVFRRFKIYNLCLNDLNIDMDMLELTFRQNTDCSKLVKPESQYRVIINRGVPEFFNHELYVCNTNDIIANVNSHSGNNPNYYLYKFYSTIVDNIKSNKPMGTSMNKPKLELLDLVSQSFTNCDPWCAYHAYDLYNRLSIKKGKLCRYNSSIKETAKELEYLWWVCLAYAYTNACHNGWLVKMYELYIMLKDTSDILETDITKVFDKISMIINYDFFSPTFHEYSLLDHFDINTQKIYQKDLWGKFVRYTRKNAAPNKPIITDMCAFLVELDQY